MIKKNDIWKSKKEIIINGQKQVSVKIIEVCEDSLIGDYIIRTKERSGKDIAFGLKQFFNCMEKVY